MEAKNANSTWSKGSPAPGPRRMPLGPAGRSTLPCGNKGKSRPERGGIVILAFWILLLSSFGLKGAILPKRQEPCAQIAGIPSNQRADDRQPDAIPLQPVHWRNGLHCSEVGLTRLTSLLGRKRALTAWAPATMDFQQHRPDGLPAVTVNLASARRLLPVPSSVELRDSLFGGCRSFSNTNEVRHTNIVPHEGVAQVTRVAQEPPQRLPVVENGSKPCFSGRGCGRSYGQKPAISCGNRGKSSTAKTNDVPREARASFIAHYMPRRNFTPKYQLDRLGRNTCHTCR
jgi:hypothetical protein